MKIILKILRKLRFYTIRTKMAAVISLLMAMISLFIFVYFPVKIEKQAIKAISDKAKSIAEITAFNIGPAMFFEDISNIEFSIKTAIQNKDIAYIVVADNMGENGEEISSYNRHYWK